MEMGYWTFGCVKCWKWKYPYGAFVYLCVVRDRWMDGWSLVCFFFGVNDC
jgi:hypothetical protein